MKLLKNNNIKVISLSVLAGVIAALAWQSQYLFPLQLIGFVPFFFALSLITTLERTTKFKIVAVFISTFIFRSVALTIGLIWLIDVSIAALVILTLMDIFILSAMLSFIIWIKRLNFVAVIFLFILFELLMQNLQMLAPFYLMGYAWSNHVSLIQYYSVFGVEGGSLMVYAVNFSIFQVIKNRKIQKINYVVFSIFILFTSFSVVKYHIGKDIEWENDEKVSLIHSEIDLRADEYLKTPSILVEETQKVAVKNSLIIMPESFFNSLDWYAHLPHNPTILYIDSVNKANQQQQLFSAMIYAPTNHPTPQSRIWEGKHYNTHNVTILKDHLIQTKSKQVFIPFLEYVPSNVIAQKINQFIPIIGDDRKLNPMDISDDFKYKNKDFDNLLCYESIFPLLAAKRAKYSTFMTVQANESWHKSHTCSYQYMNINRANTIASGIPTYRSSNYGYTAFIKPNGDVETLYKTNKKFSSLVVLLPKEISSSFYTKIAGYSYVLSGCILLVLITSTFVRKEK